MGAPWGRLRPSPADSASTRRRLDSLGKGARRQHGDAPETASTIAHEFHIKPVRHSSGCVADRCSTGRLRSAQIRGLPANLGIDGAAIR